MEHLELKRRLWWATSHVDLSFGRAYPKVLWDLGNMLCLGASRGLFSLIALTWGFYINIFPLLLPVWGFNIVYVASP